MVKEMLKKIIDGAIFALGAGVVVFFIIGTADYSRSAMKYLFHPHYLHLSDIENNGLGITFHKQSPHAKNYTVVGSVKNSGEYHWKDISIQITVMEKGHVINRCGGAVNNGAGLNVGEEGYFRVKCYDMLTDGGDYKYKVKLSYGLAFEKDT